MRLLYVIHQFFPDCHSGTEQYCLAMAREGMRRGHEVTVLSLHWHHDRSSPAVDVFEAPFENVRVIRLNHWRQLNPNDVLRDYENRHLDGWFQAVLDDVHPDAVHFFHLRQLGSNLIPVARRNGVRTVVNLMDFWFLCPRFTLLRSDGEVCAGPPEGGRGCVACAYPELQSVTPHDGPARTTVDAPDRLKALLDRPSRQLRNLASADVVVAPSRFLAERFAANGFPRERMLVEPYGLEPDRIIPIPAQRPRDPLRLAFCGVMSPWKAPHLVVEAVHESELDVLLTLHGRVEEPMFQDYIDAMLASCSGDERITFPGPYSGNDASRVFAEMDALVVPSTWYENTPFVVLEAFTAGVPVLASDLGGLSEIVQHNVNGWLFESGNVVALRQAIAAFVQDPTQIGKATPPPPRSISENFDEFHRAYRGS